MGDSALFFSFFRPCSRQTPATAKIAPSSSVKQIGGGWHIDRFGGMGFVQFSSDGKLVASDADHYALPLAYRTTLMHLSFIYLEKELVALRGLIP